MNFYFSKENRMKRAEEKEIERQKEMERQIQSDKLNKKLLEDIENEKKKYCVWITNETKNFIDTLREKNFIPSWGFEIEPDYNTQQGQGGKQYGEFFIFDIPEICGIAFDMNSKQMLYYSCPTGYYDVYDSGDTHMEYNYVLIPFTEIFKASIDVNSQTTITTISSKQNVIGRSIVGGILAGDTGAIIGGTTGKNNSVSKSEILPRQIVFNIQTTNPDYPIISFEFNKPYNASGSVSSDKSIADTMFGIFSGENELVTFLDWKQKRNCNTYTDRYYLRYHGAPKHDENVVEEYQPVIDYIMPLANLEIILKRVNKYVMQIESIIQQCNLENSSNNNKEIINELIKLAEMKKNGLLTSDEFETLKSKLI